MKTTLLAAALLLVSGVAIADPDPDPGFIGRWHNQRGSELNIESVDKDGKITGDYWSAVGGDPKGVTGKLTGFIHGDQIAFSVKFEKFDSMTSWAGQVLTAEDKSETLQTLWFNTANVPNPKEPADGWAAIKSGADNFTKGPAPKRPKK